MTGSLRLRPFILAALVPAVLSVAGCSSLWPFGSTARKIPPPPAVSAPAAAGLAWTVSVGASGVGFAPTVERGSVLAASSDGEVVRVSAADGAEIWRVKAGKSLASGVGSDADTVAVVAQDGTLIALDRDGKRRWAAQLSAEASTVPAVGLGVVVVRTSDNRISAFDSTTGRRRWTFQRQGAPLVLRQTSRILIGSDAIYAGLPGGRLVALDARTGALRWEATVSIPRGATEIERIADVVGAPVLSGREVCAVGFQGRLACVDASNGQVRWTRDVSSSSGVDADERTLVVSDERGWVHAFAPSGASLWRQEKLADRTLAAPKLAGAFVIVPDAHGFVHILSRDDGAVLARVEASGGVVAPPVAVDRVGFVQTRGGSLLAIAPR